MRDKQAIKTLLDGEKPICRELHRLEEDIALSG